jgi:translation initiation factor eIF-2B subunit gamma
LKDAHCYAFARWTLDLLEQRRELLQSVPRHFVPYVLALQYKKRALSSLSVPTLVSAEARAMSAKRIDTRDAVRCYALIAEGAAVRVTDVTSYLVLCRALAADTLSPYVPSEPLMSAATAGKQRSHIASTALIDPGTVVPSGCVIGEGSRVGSRVGVKRSVIGRHCQIGAGAKILNSVLMDHVTVADGARIHNSVLSANCYVEKDAELADCVLGERCSVNAAITLTKRKLDSNTQLPQ